VNPDSLAVQQQSTAVGLSQPASGIEWERQQNVAQTKRGRIPPEPEGEPELLVPTSQMEQEIEEQIIRGQRLMDEVSGLAGQLQPHGPELSKFNTRRCVITSIAGRSSI
jgi:hypothetical protein